MVWDQDGCRTAGSSPVSTADGGAGGWWARVPASRGGKHRVRCAREPEWAASQPLGRAGPTGALARLASTLPGRGVAAPFRVCWWERGSPPHPSQSERGEETSVGETHSFLQLLSPGKELQLMSVRLDVLPQNRRRLVPSPGRVLPVRGPACGAAARACGGAGRAAQQEKVYLSRATLLPS